MKTTSNLQVPYYVKPDFNNEYQGSMRRLEQHVEEDYVTTLRNACFKEKKDSKFIYIIFEIHFLLKYNFDIIITIFINKII